ncbi:hypothetical protein BV22DRAFT_416493 [Leucogyrophana mollusca]|uniref:Uncharacterized protein n=1 Tax=Leucogyrophana mollusca TaxID=85980 RepID=A0ACB8BK18_9AGAM|nr:hypothetical protein BV22DRAFT_416493 [Leucogyrophana mollusca]
MIGDDLSDPKYWDAAKGVVSGAPPLKSRSVSVQEICGTYQHIWDGERGHHPEGEYFFTLSVDPAVTPGTEVQPKDIIGRLKVGCLMLSTKVLIPYDEDGCPNDWEFQELKCVNEDDQGDESVGYVDQCAVTVLDVNDDSGTPFLSYVVDWGHTCISYIGKKVKDGQEKIEVLTVKEIARLGMDLDEEEAEERWKAKASQAKDQTSSTADNSSWLLYDAEDRPMLRVPMLTSRKVTFEEICGTYRRVWDEYGQPGEYDECNDNDYMKLSINTDVKPDSGVLPKNIIGSLELGDASLTIKSLRSWDDTIPDPVNRWVAEDFDYDHPDGEIADGCMITVLDVSDDDGVPLVDFAIDFGETDHSNIQIISFLGKKVKYEDEKGVCLTKSERERFEAHVICGQSDDKMECDDEESKDSVMDVGGEDKASASSTSVKAGTKRKAEDDFEGPVRAPPRAPSSNNPVQPSALNPPRDCPCPICAQNFTSEGLVDHLTSTHKDCFAVDRPTRRRLLKLPRRQFMIEMRKYATKSQTIVGKV